MQPRRLFDDGKEIRLLLGPTVFVKEVP